MAMPEIMAGGSPHSPITALINKSKNIEFKINTANFTLQLQIIKLIKDNK